MVDLKPQSYYFFVAEFVGGLAVLEYGQFLREIPKLDYSLGVSKATLKTMDSYVVFEVQDHTGYRKVDALNKDYCFETVEEAWEWVDSLYFPNTPRLRLVYGESCIATDGDYEDDDDDDYIDEEDGE